MLAQLLNDHMHELPLTERVFAIEYGQTGLWRVGLKRLPTFEKAEDWTNWCESHQLTRAIEKFIEMIPNLVIE